MSKEKMLAALPCAALCAALAMPMPRAAAAGQESMVVVRDPVTGQLRAPTPAERKALGPAPLATLRATVPLSNLVVNKPDGSRLLRLGERGLVYSVASRRTDGTLAQQCVQGEHGVANVLAQPAPTARKKEEHRHEDR